MHKNSMLEFWRPGHRFTNVRWKKKINEIIQNQPDTQKRLTKVLIS